jgi:hypothetical protein
MSTRRHDLTSVSDILGGVRLPKSVKDHVKNHEIWSKWFEIVGNELSRVTAPAELKGKTLEVNVAHQAWAQQLHFLKPSILGKIRALCPQAVIKDLHFKVGKIEIILPAEIGKQKTSAGVSGQPVKLSERLEMTLRAIEDPELRATIRSAMEAHELRRA